MGVITNLIYVKIKGLNCKARAAKRFNELQMFLSSFEEIKMLKLSQGIL